jgi:hypothetical protein
MDYKGNSVWEYIDYIDKNLEKDKKVEKIELKAQEPNSKEKQLQTAKRTGKMMLDKLERDVTQGYIPATFAVLQLKQMSKMMGEVIKNIEEMAKDELTGTDYYQHGDYKITYKQGSKTVDYSGCEEVEVLEGHLKGCKLKLKLALEGVEKGVTQVQPGHCFVDSDGEILKLPKWKYNKSSIVLTKA